MNQGQSSRTAMLDRVAALTESDAGFARFFKAAVLATEADDLARQAPEQFEAALRQSYRHLLAYSGGKSQISATSPTRPGEPLVLDIISPDMSFIVDSALAALRAAGGTVRLFAHPVVRVDGGMVGETGQALSVLHIHSDPVAELDALVAELDATMTAVKVFIACLAASVVGIAFGLDRPDWAIVSALLILQWGPDRLLGSVLSIGLFAGLHLLDLGPWGLLLALAACQFFAEIFVVRNYVLCVIATTPLALMMGNALQLPLGETVVSRAIEVLLSVIFAVGVLWVVLRDAEPAHHARLLTAAPDDVLPQRRDLQFELLSERRAVQSLAANPPEVAAERWATHLEVQSAGYALLDRCNDRPDQRLPIGDIQDVADRVSRD